MINREKVAKLLREAGKNAGDWCDSADEAFEKVDTIIGTYDSCKYSDFFNRLADLIDPTCHMSWECGNGDDDTKEYMANIAFTPEDTVACHCHECDEVFRYDRVIIPNYCPACGARVVRDE